MNPWIGPAGSGGFVRFDGSNWTVYTKDNSGLPHNNVFYIAIDAQENKWIGTIGGGLAVHREGGVILPFESNVPIATVTPLSKYPTTWGETKQR